jgi:uncharacterized LabA/DUF88 family protein
MNTNIYVDAFNLYYGCLRGTPFKWLDVAMLCKVLLPRDTIHRIKYFTAVVEARSEDPGQRLRQQFYLRALATIPNLSIYYGHFLSHAVSMPLAANPKSKVIVIKTEEKGSDVNIATELLVDAFNDDFDLAVVVSNDSDLLAPIKVVRRQFGKRVGLLNPQRHPSVPLEREVDFLKSIRPGALRKSQFPATMSDSKGSFHKPPMW